jgi:dienelactone hydrolase
MKTLLLLVLLGLGLSPSSPDDDWNPVPDAAPAKTLGNLGRPVEVYKHGIRKEWGYKVEQQDTFIVLHPKADRKGAPLYVVLHSAGHDVFSCIQCTPKEGNHDIYRSPDDFYALYLDCRANRGDWWWGGMPANDAELVRRNSGGDPRPVERRVLDTVKWVMRKYEIDPNRVYLCGNSMGGSGTLGIGMRNGDLFAAIKANVPAGIEHASNRLYFPPMTPPESPKLPDPPVVIDYSAPNDSWSFGHERFVKAMNDRKYALYFYWGPYGHANNTGYILSVNDLINSFAWLDVKRNEAYPVFTNASCNDTLPWPDHLGEKAPGQVNAFFRWKNVSDGNDRFEMDLFLTSAADLKTTFKIPAAATADVSIRRLQKLQAKPGELVKWSFGPVGGTVKVDETGLITLPHLELRAQPIRLTLSR